MSSLNLLISKHIEKHKHEDISETIIRLQNTIKNTEKLLVNHSLKELVQSANTLIHTLKKVEKKKELILLANIQNYDIPLSIKRDVLKCIISYLELELLPFAQSEDAFTRLNKATITQKEINLSDKQIDSLANISIVVEKMEINTYIEKVEVNNCSNFAHGILVNLIFAIIIALSLSNVDIKDTNFMKFINNVSIQLEEYVINNHISDSINKSLIIDND